MLRYEGEMTIANNAVIAPMQPKAEPDYLPGAGWVRGYEFRQFLGNVYAHLGEALSKVEGMQQLVHHYYLQNGSINASNAAKRIKQFIGETRP